MDSIINITHIMDITEETHIMDINHNTWIDFMDTIRDHTSCKSHIMDTTYQEHHLIDITHHHGDHTTDYGHHI
jgi:hypothetical protein